MNHELTSYVGRQFEVLLGPRMGIHKIIFVQNKFGKSSIITDTNIEWDNPVELINRIERGHVIRWI